MNPSEQRMVDMKILDMFKKGAIQVVSNQKDKGFSE